MGMEGQGDDLCTRQAHAFAALWAGETYGMVHGRVLTDAAGAVVDYCLLAVNETFARMADVSMAELEGRRASEAFAGSAFCALDALDVIARVAREGGAGTREICCLAQQRWYSIDVFRPAPEEFIALYREITARMDRDAMLRESRSKLDAVLESMTDAVFIADAAGNLLDFNDAFATFHRFAGKEEARRSFVACPHLLDVCFADGAPAPVEEWAVPRALRGERATNVIYLLRRKDTGESWVGSYSFGPLRNAERRIIGAVVVARDITAPRKAMEALRQSEARIKEGEEALRVVFNSTYDAILLHEVDGSIVDVNETFLRLYGVADAATACTLTVRDFSADSAPLERLPQLWAEVIAGQARLFEWPAKRISDGQTFDVEVYLRAIHLKGRQMLLATVRDITARKRAEAELQQLAATLEERVQERTAALEATNKELEAFSYSVSHDLRAPLRSIDGFSKLLLEKYAGQIDSSGQDYLSRVRNAALRMTRLIDDMLDLSRVGRREMRQAPVNLSEVAEVVIADLRQREPERQVQVVVAPELMAHGDSRLLRIVLENLLGNAWKFTGKTPDACIEVGMTRVKGETVYYVRDNGAGFDMQYADKLFTPFQRLHTEEEFPGSGIGLAIVQRIILRHGGRVWAESQEGAGTTIYFTVGNGTV